MVTITFDLNKLELEEVIALQAMLTAYDRAAIKGQIEKGQFTEETEAEQVLRLTQRDAVRRPIPSQLPVEVPAAASAENEAAEAKPKRGRPAKKAEAATEPVDPTPQTSSQPSPSTSPEGGNSADSAPTEAPTFDQLNTALKGLREKRGDIQPCIDLLAEFGCARVGDVPALPVAKQIEFLGRCNA